MGRVLVIQGAPALLDALRTTLAPRGHEIEPCGGDVEAVRVVRQRPVDVVVTDPVSSIDENLALAQELQHACPGIRTIVRAPAVDRGRVIEALRARVFACFTPPYDDLEIVDMVRSALAADAAGDDIVVISGLPHWLTLRVSCRLLTADRLVRFLTEFEATLPEQDRDLLMAAFREMLLNAMEHGAGFSADKVVEVTAARTARAIVYHFRDPGGGFSGSHAERAAATRDPEDIMATALKRAELGLRPGGLGMLIVRQIADELVYNEKGNEVLLIKHIEPTTTP
jgi:anti-sigma regulatory factor (Ser/Thr protein kinase)